MHFFLSKKTALKLKLLAWYQILGGICGIALTIWLLAHTNQITGLILLFLLVAFGLFGFSIYCGRLLLSDKYLFGFNLTIVNQALQILSFKMLGYGFMYIAGSMLLCKISFNHGFNFSFNFSLTSTWNIAFNTDDTPFELGINFVAVFMLYWVEKLQTLVKKEKAIANEEENEATLAPIEEVGDAPA
ncbi:hypothetical protein [Mucilaginibacter sp. UYCu711]|uniref:hypothetical protein n=1 Tax=Mucilaginibacter sp. UYCu711 TaxID=3156339 RepID=UPI003D2187EC